MKKIHLMTIAVGLLFGSVNSFAWAQQPPTAAAKPAPVPRPALLDGEWIGTLQAGETQLQLVLHLSKNSQGEWQAKLDSINQSVYGMEASRVTRNEEAFSFELPSVGAKFQGKILPDHRTIRGIWEQGGTGLPVRFEKRAAGADSHLSASAISPVEGTWQGAIETGNMRMRLQLHLSHDDKKRLAASVDSLDQGVQGIPAANVSEKSGEVKLELPAFNAEYDGTLSPDKNEIKGHWSQNDNLEALNFRRSDQVLELRRPQNPAKPYPYREQEISFAAGDGKATLAGTFTVPAGTGPFPAVALVGGSGPNDRDESVAGHQPFLVLADFLARKGIAVLRYDKRGISSSTGNFSEATLEDFARDAKAAVSYLAKRTEVDPRRLGVIGHSEGGILAALAATRSPDVKWTVLLATPATTGEHTLLRQSELIARAGGLPEDQIERSLAFDRKAYAAVRQSKDAAALESRLRELVDQSGLGASMPPAALQAQLKLMGSPWFREFLDFDPQPVLAKLQCPVLALAGDRDLQVDSLDNVPLLRKIYESSGNKDFTVVEIEGVNHLFQKAQSGSPALYGAIEETIAPEVLTAIGNWLASHTQP